MGDPKWVAGTGGLAARVRFHEAFRALVAEGLTADARNAATVAGRLSVLLANEVEGDACYHGDDDDPPGWVDYLLPVDGEPDRFVLYTAEGVRFVVTVERVPAFGNCDACDLPGGVEDARHHPEGAFLHTTCPTRWQ